MTDAAASQTGDAGAGQAAGAQQGAQQQGQDGSQGGQGQQGQGQQGDGQGTAQQTGDAAAAAAAAAAGSAPPERYELRLPEQSVLDQSDLDVVATLAKAKGWTNEQAQSAITEMHTSLSEQSARFRSELDADPEVGGAHLEQAQLLAVRVLDRYLPATEADGQLLRAVMNKSGYGNYRPLVKLLARLGKAMSEDQPGTGATGRAFTEPKRSQADRLFGDAKDVRPQT